MLRNNQYAQGEGTSLFSPSDLAEQGNELSRRMPEKEESSVLNAAASPLHKET